MGLLNGDSTSHSDTSSSSNTTFTPDAGQMEDWNKLIGGSEGQREFYVNTPPPQATVADPTDLTNEYWNKAKGQTDFDTEYYHQPLRETYGETSGARIDPNNINFKQDYQFAPGTVDFNDPWKTGVPTVGKGGGLGATAADYAMSTERVKADQVQAERISAPGSIDRISGLERVSGPTLEQYQMGPAQQVSGPGVRDFQMGPAERVTAPELQQYQMGMSSQISPTGLASTQSWTDPGVAQSFMSPYQQNVVEQQKKRALEDWQVQNQMLGSEAAKAGAFGGSRHAVREATAARDMEDQMAMLQATGLQSAYQQGQNQFNTQQQLGLGAQQFNLGQGMQAQMSNQAMEQAMRQANLQSQLQTQGLGAQMTMQGQLANQAAGLQVGQTNLGALQQAEALRQQFQMQGQLANQAAGLQVGQANLGANLQTQGLGATLGQQAQLANQGQTFNQAMANQQASKFEREQQLQASLANQSTGLQGMMANQGANLQAGLANQATNFQSGLASMQAGQQGAMFNAQQGMQAALANQGANMTAMGQQYAGGLQGALQTQNLGFQGQVTGGQMNQASQFQQEQAKQNAMGFNLNALQAQGQMGMNMANLGLAGQQANLATQESRARAAESQQGHAQQQADVNYANAMQNYMTPLQINQWMANMMAQRPMPYSQSSTGTQNTNSKGPTPGLLNTIVGAGTTAAGMMMPGKKAHGGLIDAYRRGGRVLRYAEGGLGNAYSDDSDFDDAGELLYTTPEGIGVYAPKKKVSAKKPAGLDRVVGLAGATPPPAKPPLPEGLASAEEKPGFLEGLKGRYARLQEKVNKKEPRQLGIFPWLYAGKEDEVYHRPTTQFGEFVDAMQAFPPLGIPLMEGTKVAGKVQKVAEKLPAILKDIPLVERAKGAMRAAKVRTNADVAKSLIEDESKISRIIRPETGLAAVEQKPLLIPQAKSAEAPALFDAAGRPAQSSGLAAAAPGGKKPSAKVLAAMEARRANPAIQAASPYLLPIEESKLIFSDANVKAFERLGRELPTAHRMESLALLGSPKRGWYRGSSQAIYDIFKSDVPGREKDPARFAQTLAAMSPQTSVENNLINTLNVWKNWTAAGRPTDPKQIKAIMGQSVMGNKGEDSVLGAWFPNVVRALTAEDPDTVTLSGPKVDSFFRNLLGDVQRVTNDAWMANVGGFPQSLLGGKPTKLQLGRGDSGFGPGYAAASVPVRKAGKSLGWDPSEVQEAGWSAGKLLYETAEELGISPQEVLQRGLITPEALRGTPDFTHLFREKGNRKILEQAGYGPQLESMRPPVGLAAAQPMTASHQREAEAVAKTLDDLQRQRGSEKRFGKMGGLGSASVIGTEQAEAIPGAGTGHLERMINQSWKNKQKFHKGVTDPFKNIQGGDVLYDALKVPNLPQRKTVGAWRPGGRPPEVNPVSSLPVELQMMGGAGGQLYPSQKEQIEAILAVRGGMTGQKIQAMNIVQPAQEAGGAGQVLLPKHKGEPKKVTPRNMQGLMKQFPHLDFGHTGPHMNVFNFANEAGVTEQELKQVQKLVKATDWIHGNSIGPYIDFSDAWAKQPGSGAVTEQMFSHVHKLSPEDYAALDRAVRQPAGGVLDFYAQQQGAKRQDLMNLLQIIRDEGLAGAEKALKSGAFLPGLVGAMIAPSLLSRPEEGRLQ